MLANTCYNIGDFIRELDLYFAEEDKARWNKAEQTMLNQLQGRARVIWCPEYGAERTEVPCAKSARERVVNWR